MKQIIVNLKDWLNYEENIDFSVQIEGLPITVLPSLPYLYLYKGIKTKIGAQDISKFESGAHTGSISAEHLRNFGVEVVILNHRECQKDEDRLKAKVEMALKYGIEVILCIDDYRQEELEKIENILKTSDNKKITIAYEPIKEIPLDQICENLNMIKEYFSKYELSYIYGGNISSDNFTEYDKALNVKGYLISSHALDIKELKKIVNLAK